MLRLENVENRHGKPAVQHNVQTSSMDIFLFLMSKVGVQWIISRMNKLVFCTLENFHDESYLLFKKYLTCYQKIYIYIYLTPHFSLCTKFIIKMDAKSWPLYNSEWHDQKQRILRCYNILHLEPWITLISHELQ